MGGGLRAATIHIRTRVENELHAEREIVVRSRVDGETVDESVTIPAGSRLDVTQDLVLHGARRWSPDEPQLYVLETEVRVGNEIVEDWEGCLSIPEIRGRVPRQREITVRAYDRNGEQVEVHAHDFPARVIQHETDHLDGVLFVDRMRSFESLTFLDEYSRYWAKD